MRAPIILKHGKNGKYLYFGLDTLLGYPQGSKGIRQWPIIPNDDTQNYPIFRLKLVIKKFGHLTK